MAMIGVIARDNVPFWMLLAFVVIGAIIDSVRRRRRSSAERRQKGD